MKYPADFVDDNGLWWVIFEGHNLDRSMIEATLVDHLGQRFPEQHLEVTEDHYDFVPRIKHCSKRDGWGCDNEGEWHGHWFEVQPNPNATDIEFTTARWAADVTQPQADEPRDSTPAQPVPDEGGNGS